MVDKQQAERAEAGRTRPKRKDTRRKINFVVTQEEFDWLHREAGAVGVSAWMRNLVFAGGVRSQDTLQAVAALHVLGIQLMELGRKPTPATITVLATLELVRREIDRLAGFLPGPDGDADGEA